MAPKWYNTSRPLSIISISWAMSPERPPCAPAILLQQGGERAGAAWRQVATAIAPGSGRARSFCTHAVHSAHFRTARGDRAREGWESRRHAGCAVGAALHMMGMRRH